MYEFTSLVIRAFWDFFLKKTGKQIIKKLTCSKYAYCDKRPAR